MVTYMFGSKTRLISVKVFLVSLTLSVCLLDKAFDFT